MSRSASSRSSVTKKASSKKAANKKATTRKKRTSAPKRSPRRPSKTRSDRLYLGVDIGSVGAKMVLVDDDVQVVANQARRTNADPLSALRDGMRALLQGVDCGRIGGAGVTGSGKELAAMAIDADLVKNEISAHGYAAMQDCGDVRTVIEIGGQDSKIILLKNGLIEDFAMNSVCAAGTGSFLEQQAGRLNLSIDQLSLMALESTRALSIAARCTVFAESDMVYKQQVGYPREDIVYGLCLSLAKNYLNTLGRNKKLESPICFQGGVAANLGMRRAFEQVLGESLHIPEHFMHMGAIGAALFAKRQKLKKTRFKPELIEQAFTVDMFDCEDCENRCNVVSYKRRDVLLGYKGDVCGKYSVGVS